MTDPHFNYLCDRKRGLTKQALIEDIRSSIEVMKNKGYIDSEFKMEIPLYPGYVLKVSIESER